tara:strand:- start:163 stop:447 length:285 start_codon:yes stop_codon:yes gene_type:complete
MQCNFNRGTSVPHNLGDRDMRNEIRLLKGYIIGGLHILAWYFGQEYLPEMLLAVFCVSAVVIIAITTLRYIDDIHFNILFRPDNRDSQAIRKRK